MRLAFLGGMKTSAWLKGSALVAVVYLFAIPGRGVPRTGGSIPVGEPPAVASPAPKPEPEIAAAPAAAVPPRPQRKGGRVLRSAALPPAAEREPDQVERVWEERLESLGVVPEVELSGRLARRLGAHRMSVLRLYRSLWWLDRPHLRAEALQTLLDVVESHPLASDLFLGTVNELGDLYAASFLNQLLGRDALRFTRRVARHTTVPAFAYKAEAIGSLLRDQSRHHADSPG
jgi:hypothetical protein